jgi:hypothetical protein
VEVTALFPILALIFTKKLRPTIMGSFRMVDVVGMMARPLAIHFLQTQGDVVF